MVVAAYVFYKYTCVAIKLDQYKLFWLTGPRSVNNRVYFRGEGGGGGLGMIALR